MISIGDQCFSGCKSLTDIKLPEKLETIKSRAFWDAGLKSLVIPSSVTYMGEACLSGCDNLEELVIPFVGESPNSTEASEKTLFGYLFGQNKTDGSSEVIQRYCRKGSTTTVLVAAYIPNSLTKVTITGERCLANTFMDCKNLKEVIMSGNVEYVGEGAFSGCSGLKEVIMPKSLKVIFESAFSGCSGLKGMNLPDSLERIYDNVFYGCELRNITIPSKVKVIFQDAFNGCIGLKEVRLRTCNFCARGRSLAYYFGKNIETYHIGGIVNLQNGMLYNVKSKIIHIDEGCNKIDDYSLDETVADTLYLPKSLTYIGERNVCDINHIAYCGMEDDWAKIENHSSIYPNEFHYGIIVPGEIFEKNGMNYCAIDTLPATASIIAGKMAYSRNIYIPRNVEVYGKIFKITSIADNAFKDCTDLDTIFYEGNKIEWKKLIVGINNVVINEVPIIFNYNHSGNSNDEPIGANSIYIENLAIKKENGQKLLIALRNSEPITGVQFEIDFPEGMSLSKNGVNGYEAVINPSRSSETRHDIFEVKKVDNGRYFVICSSSSNATFKGNDGGIMSLYINVDKNMKDGEYKILLKNICLSYDDANVVRTNKASFSVAIYSYTRGDVNNDSEINIGDISCIANIILGSIEEFYSLEAADVNEDGDINVGDIAGTAGYILNGYFSPINKTLLTATQGLSDCYPQLSIPEIVMDAGSNQETVVGLRSNGDVTAFQFDLHLPDGLSIISDINGEYIIQNKTIGSSHILNYRQQNNNDFRVISYSVNNQTYCNGNVDLLSLGLVADRGMLNGTYIMALKNIVIATKQGVVKPDDMYIRITIRQNTGINNITDEQGAFSKPIYNLQGIRLQKFERGINIINGKKIIINQ